MWSQLPLALCLLGNITGSVASSLATFEDTNCKTSQNTIDGEDGYPDGVCTNIKSVADSTYGSFMFITLDDGCTPTVYQKDTTSDSCSGAAYVAYISKCYDTSWEYYSIDECSPVTTRAASSSASSDSSYSSASGISGGAIAGAIVGTVLGLAIIAAVCAYFFWFWPKQKEKTKRDKADAEKAASEAEIQKQEGDAKQQNLPRELRQTTPELHSPGSFGELPSQEIAEVEGDKGGHELDPDSEPAELPGDHMHQLSHSTDTSSPNRVR